MIDAEEIIKLVSNYEKGRQIQVLEKREGWVDIDMKNPDFNFNFQDKVYRVSSISNLY